jgi:hypothetical protein
MGKIVETLFSLATNVQAATGLSGWPQKNTTTKHQNQGASGCRNTCIARSQPKSLPDGFRHSWAAVEDTLPHVTCQEIERFNDSD